MKTYICYEGHIQHSSGESDDAYFPKCGHLGCNQEVVELPQMELLPPSRLEDEIREAVEGRR